MAKVKITGHASGSGVITVTAPNTSTDRTVTLPDETATLSTFNPDGAVTINDTGADVDFRVESDTVTHALFVQGSDGRVGIGGTPTNMLSLFPTEQSSIRKIDFGLYNGGTDNTFVQTAHHSSNGNVREIGLEGSIVNFYTGADSGTSTSNRLSITADGRGLSQFTAKAWINFNGQNTVAIRDSHNVSSITDNGTGNYNVTMSNAMGSVNYCVTAVSGRGGGEDMHALVPQSNFNFTTTQFRILTLQAWDTAHDASYVGATVFGD